MALDIRGKKGAKTHAHGEKDGATVVEEEEFVPGRTSGGPTANVNVNAGTRQGLPNYSDVRYGCSITLPCEPTAEGIEEAYQFGEKWCLEKMDELHVVMLKEDDA